ncbi:mevalonate kinase [Neodiprion virginianus]|uniref:mevalonate kinase n=1 Tax=Neodiprion virginianus TaxID=2961670 RepID=UPI001EE6CC97|nr:mevalonate kinase [Neodiprion virginianus]
MASFKITAPGKLILYGEHAVVYGKTALAASLDLRTTLEFEELKPDQLYVYLLFPKISLSEKISIRKIEDYFFNDRALKIDKDSDHFYKHVQNFAEDVGYANLPQKLAIEAFFYLFISILKYDEVKIKPFRIQVGTMLSVSSGLGSSASFAVCLTTCFVHYVNLQKNVSTTLDKTQLDAISEYALKCEKIMHGNPSGIDNAICTYGSIVEFRKNEILQPITGTKSMRVLLVDTKVLRSTKALVEKVAELKEKYPNVFQPILESIDNVSQKALSIIKQMKDLCETDTTALNEFYAELLTLIDINQALLASCQVSHSTIDEICAEARKHSLRAKLTGAGGGGYAYVLLPPDTNDDTITEISNAFVERGYGIELTNLGGPGVMIES